MKITMELSIFLSRFQTFRMKSRTYWGISQGKFTSERKTISKYQKNVLTINQIQNIIQKHDTFYIIFLLINSKFWPICSRFHPKCFKSRQKNWDFHRNFRDLKVNNRDINQSVRDVGRNVQDLHRIVLNFDQNDRELDRHFWDFEQ